MSIQAECREAMNRLAERGDVFTEFDVANEASHEGWSSKHFEQAVRQAYNVLQGDYKKGKLVRFGPVEFQGIQDYARRGTKIVYADAEKGPDGFETPNGIFPRLYAATDKLVRAGRRVGTSRDDTKPWDTQEVATKPGTTRGPAIDPAPLLRKIEELQAANRRLEKQLAEVTAPDHNGHTPTVNGDMTVPVKVSELIELLAVRLSNDPRLVEGVKTSVAEALIS